jgi:hypothetical protein
MQFGISEKARIYGDQVLGKFLENFATTGLLLTLFIALMTKAATSAGWVQLLLAIGRMRRSANNSLEAKYEKLLILLLLIGLVNVAFVILAKFVLSKRYLVPVALVIIVYAGFGLSALHSRVRQSVPKYKLMYLGVSLLIVCQFLVILWPTGTNKRFELAAVSWIVNNTPKNARIYYDSDRLRYYAGQPYLRYGYKELSDGQLFEGHIIDQYDYAVLRVKKANAERSVYLERKLNSKPVKEFDDGHQNKVLIFHVPH